MVFDCTWDDGIKLESCITGTILLICAILITWNLIKGIKSKSYWKSSFLGITIIFLLYIVSSSLLNTPKEIELTDNHLSINNYISYTQIDYQKIKDIKRVTKEDILGETRTFGSSGIGADQGKWNSKKLGYYKKYTTDPKNQVWIDIINNENIMFSCDNPDQLVEMVKARLK
ncbi:PH domain-containing protein [Dysgonomonas sp. Marseille-P4361]|uniref:PH domain-containing protein n=1 Tax=Dysgonomonas sp. Marseille-P4361 TaxID=2161820 RepID=UPI000D551B37|nr:PH domain-containing protein [Dysgonomonas sp. Marseille-P4361]